MELAILKSKVLARIDEAAPDISGGVAARYNIEEFLNDALTSLTMVAPLRLLNIAKITTAPTKRDDGSGTVALPDDFIRLASFQMEDWKRPVNTTIPANSPAANRQFNHYIRAGKAKPVVLISADEKGGTLEYFTSDTSNVKTAIYVKKGSLETVNQELVEPLCWLAAALVLGTTNEITAAQFCNQRFENIITHLAQ